MTREKKPKSRHAATEEVPQYGDKVCFEAATGRVRWRQDLKS
ncbi:MAG TPA: hypothetical protein VE956_18130 [Nodularia sp. (in: cyanobacteria)]|nr:hypothetical protein [Nodularia sp. (in: cyanobacteria)]